MTNKCVIDIGSNTIKIFIAQLDTNGKIHPLILKRRMTRLGKNLSKNTNLSSESKDLVIKYLEEYLTICNQYNIKQENILITATAACRNANDGQQFIQNIKEKYNIKNIKILSGKEEAKYTFLGVLDDIKDDNNQKYCVIDVGGGSFQISGGTKNEFYFGTSIQKGCNPITELFKLNNPVNEELLFKAINHITQIEIEGLPKNYKPARIIGVGGTLKIMQLMLKDKNSTSPLTKEELRTTANWLAPLTVNERFEWFKTKFTDERYRIDAGLTFNRAEVILAGICIIIGLLNKLDSNKAYISNTDAKSYVIKLSEL